MQTKTLLVNADQNPPTVSGTAATCDNVLGAALQECRAALRNIVTCGCCGGFIGELLSVQAERQQKYTYIVPLLLLYSNNSSSSSDNNDNRYNNNNK